MYATLTIDGTLRRHVAKPDLAALQKAVEGHIEVVHLDFLPGRVDLFVNEEGKLNDLPLNLVATLMAAPVLGSDVIVGPVAFTGCVDDEGETLPLTEEQYAVLHGLVELSIQHILRELFRKVRP